MEFTTEDLVWAVLAMNAYHRGYDEQLNGALFDGSVLEVFLSWE